MENKENSDLHVCSQSFFVIQDVKEQANQGPQNLLA